MTNQLIQWTKGAKYWDKAYNPVVGCIWTSEGCDNCYASDLCRRFKMNGDNWFLPTGKPTARPPKKGVVFVGNMTEEKAVELVRKLKDNIEAKKGTSK